MDFYIAKEDVGAQSPNPQASLEDASIFFSQKPPALFR